MEEEEKKLSTPLPILIEAKLILNFSLSFELILLGYKWNSSSETKLLILYSPVPSSLFTHIPLFTPQYTPPSFLLMI